MLGLERANLMPAQFCREVGVFAVGFERSSPARIAWKIQDRRVDVGIAKDARFFSCDLANFVDKGAIPRAGHAQLRWKTCRVGMSQPANALVREVDGNTESRLFHEESLNSIDGFCVRGEGKRQF